MKVYGIGENIRRIRIERGISQVALSKLSGVSQGQICKYELGKSIAQMKNISKIACALGVSESDITREPPRKIMKADIIKAVCTIIESLPKCRTIAEVGDSTAILFHDCKWIEQYLQKIAQIFSLSSKGVDDMFIDELYQSCKNNTICSLLDQPIEED